MFLRLSFLAVSLVALVVKSTHGLKIDFSRLAIPVHSPLYNVKRGGPRCEGNPCQASKPFLCRDSPKCIALKFVCDETFDCDDGFDEDPSVCNAADRPSFEDLYYFLDSEKKWMVPTFFNGADPELVAHALTVANDMNDLKDQVGMTDENVSMLRKAMQGASEGDERPLLKLGMPSRSWHEVQYVLQKLVDNGLAD